MKKIRGKRVLDSAPAIGKAEYAQRIKQFAAGLKPKSVAIVVSNPERTRSNDTEYPYRQSSDVLYLNGFPESHALLVVHNLGRRPQVIMFVLPKDAAREQWTGIRIGVKGAQREYLANKAYTVDQVQKVLPQLLAKAEHVYHKLGRNEEFDKLFLAMWQNEQKPLLNPEAILHGMRMIKSAREIEMVRHACEISAQAHCAAAVNCRPGLTEYQLQGVLEHIFIHNGAMAPAYGSIVANGNNAWVLHYVSNQGELKDGDLVLIDAACEYRGYASDITRTFPVNGKFTEAQREIYELVLEAQRAAIKVAKPGASLFKVHSTAARVLRQGLFKLGILPAETATAVGARRAYKQAKKAGKEQELTWLGAFFPHGTSHWLGLDVHDVGTNGTRSNTAKRRLLEPGMIFTVEPGLYFDRNDKRVPEKYRGISVRIEDDVLVTASGNEILTSGVPTGVKAIEAMMAPQVLAAAPRRTRRR